MLRLDKETQLAAQMSQEAAFADPDFAQKATDNPFLFSRIIMGNEPVFPEELTDECAGDWVKLFNFIFSFGAPDGIQQGVLNSPRNSLKTTLLVSRCVYLIAHDRNIRILYTTNNKENALNFSRLVHTELSSNELLIKSYGEFKPETNSKQEASGTKPWRQDYFTVTGRTTKAREPTLTASSVGTTKVGMHYDIIIFDDCVDDKNSRTADGLRGAIRWFATSTALVDQKSKYGPGGCVLDVGTRYADGDLHGWLLGEIEDDESPSDLYESLVLRSMNEPNWDAKLKDWTNPSLNFPHILDAERLAKARRYGPFHFSTQYQNECVTPEDATFRPEWFRFIPAYDVPAGLKYFVFTDFAFGLDDSNDRTAIWVVGLDWERKAYCVDFDVGRWALNERCRRTIALIQKYDAEAVALEQVVSNESIKTNLIRLRDEQRIRFRIVDIGGRSIESKQLRIISMQPRFEEENPPRIMFVQRDENDVIGIKRQFLRRSKAGKLEGDIAVEFLRFPRATHDDIPDALSDIDKIDPATKTPYFSGSSHKVAGPQVLGPSCMNGKVLWRQEGPWDVKREAKKSEDNFYSRHAARLRRSGRDS